MKFLAMLLFRRKIKRCPKCGGTVHELRDQVVVIKLDGERRVVSKTLELAFVCCGCREQWWEVLK